MDFFKGVGDFFNGIFGNNDEEKKRKQREAAQRRQQQLQAAKAQQPKPQPTQQPKVNPLGIPQVDPKKAVPQSTQAPGVTLNQFMQKPGNKSDPKKVNPVIRGVGDFLIKQPGEALQTAVDRARTVQEASKAGVKPFDLVHGYKSDAEMNKEYGPKLKAAEKKTGTKYPTMQQRTESAGVLAGTAVGGSQDLRDIVKSAIDKAAPRVAEVVDTVAEDAVNKFKSTFKREPTAAEREAIVKRVNDVPPQATKKIDEPNNPKVDTEIVKPGPKDIGDE